MLEPTIPPEEFGKDHWSTLVFIETRCVDYGGKLDHDRMRCNMHRHPEFAGNRRSHRVEWLRAWGTILKDETQLVEHDDWDCLIDLAKAGYIEIIDLDLGMVSLTDQGWTVAHQLRRFIAEHQSYKDFCLEGGHNA